MKNLIIDERIRKQEYEYLSKYFNVKKLPLSEDVYDEISGHSDIFYCKIDDKIICAPNAKIIEKDFIIGKEKVENEYPKDIYYNACQIGKNVVGSKYSDEKIITTIIVNQGYTKCSIAITGENSCITSDKGIYQKLKLKDVDVDLIEEEKINLLDRNGNVSKMNGFIGGATFLFDNKFILFGDINKLKTKDIIKKHLEKHNLELIDFKGLEINDYGSAIIY